MRVSRRDRYRFDPDWNPDEIWFDIMGPRGGCAYLALLSRETVQKLVAAASAALVAPVPKWQKIDKLDADEKYRTAARTQYGNGDDVEIDRDATVSIGDDPGAFVQAWLWVTDDDAGIETDDTPLTPDQRRDALRESIEEDRK